MIPPTDGQPDRLPQTLAALTRGIEAGLHTGAQAYVSRGGEVVADFAVGMARPGVQALLDPARERRECLWQSVRLSVRRRNHFFSFWVS